MKKIKKLVAILLITLLLFGRVGLPMPAFAEEAPTAPTAPTAPEAPVWPASSETTETNALTTIDGPLQNSENGTSSSGNVGDTSINTGDANNNASILTNGNNNLSADGACCAGSTTVTNTGNGTGSTNIAGSDSTINNDTDQENSATVANGLNQ